MAKKATFRRAAGAGVSLESGDGSLETGDRSPEVVDEVDTVDGVDEVDEVDGGLEDHPTGGVVVLEGEVGASALMGLGEFEEVPVEVRRALPRADLAGYGVGDVVAVVRLAPGWSLHSLVDHVRDGFCNARK